MYGLGSVWVCVFVIAKDHYLVRMQSSSGGTRSVSISWRLGGFLPTANDTNTCVTSQFSHTHTNKWINKIALTVLKHIPTYRQWGGSPPPDWPARRNSRDQTLDLCPDWSASPAANQTGRWSGFHCTPARWDIAVSSGKLPPYIQERRAQQV